MSFSNKGKGALRLRTGCTNNRKGACITLAHFDKVQLSLFIIWSVDLSEIEKDCR
jgi:hypothetical protein